jgi:hypothetical protein
VSKLKVFEPVIIVRPLVVCFSLIWSIMIYRDAGQHKLSTSLGPTHNYHGSIPLGLWAQDLGLGQESIGILIWWTVGQACCDMSHLCLQKSSACIASPSIRALSSVSGSRNPFPFRSSISHGGRIPSPPVTPRRTHWNDNLYIMGWLVSWAFFTSETCPHQN